MKGLDLKRKPNLIPSLLIYGSDTFWISIEFISVKVITEICNFIQIWEIYRKSYSKAKPNWIEVSSNCYRQLINKNISNWFSQKKKIALSNIRCLTCIVFLWLNRLLGKFFLMGVTIFFPWGGTPPPAPQKKVPGASQGPKKAIVFCKYLF